MKNSRKCPKCHSENIYHQAKVPTAGGLFGQATLGLQDTATKTRGEFSVYICKDCGYSELWLGPDGISFLKDL